MPREDRRVLNIKQDSINEIDYYPSSQTVSDGDMIISHPKGKTLRLYKKLKGMLWWNDFTKDGNQIIEKNSEVKGKLKVKGKTVLGTEVGIGISELATMVHIEHPSLDTVVRLGAPSSKTSAMQIYSNAGAYTWQLGVPFNADRFVIDEASISAGNDLVIESGGNVGIATTNPAHKLDVVGTAGLSTGTAWTNTSDVRIKTNVETVTGGLDKINQLRPVSFNYISDYADIHQEIDASKKYNSFIANEYAEVFPDAVSVGRNLERITPSSDIGEPDEVEVLIEDLLQFNPHDLHVYLVKAVQELSAKVTTLENN